ncbi:MAG: dihydrodipicolinate synthase family protein [Pseudomonadota bacterium]
MLAGTLPVLATPFTAKGEVDLQSLGCLVDHAVASGADGVVFPGVASEFDFLSAGERNSALEVVAARLAGRVPVIVGASASDAERSGALASQGEERGASAAMVMAPAAIGRDAKALSDFFAAVAGRIGIPIVMQNAPPPVGSGLPIESMLEVATAVPAIRYIKEETMPCGQRITRLLDGAPASIQGVIGGAGGRYIVDELNRGACGTMPASELTEAHVAIVHAHRAGDAARARRLFDRILPLLSFQAVFRMRMTKAVLRSRGLFATEIVRAPGPELDGQDRRELATMLAEVTDLLTIAPPDVPRLLDAA